MSTSINSPEFAGVCAAAKPSRSPLDQVDLDDDLDGEREGLPDLSSLDLEDVCAEELDMVNELQLAVHHASKGVSEETDRKYRQLSEKCQKFLEKKKLIKAGQKVICSNPPENMPLFISAWIMDSCDELNLDNTRKSPDVKRDTYSHAQKMRAAMTYMFGRIHGLGNLPWQKSEVTNKMRGNPSVSEGVSSYMVSLRRRKVQAGETATSARAITPAIMKAMYHFNHQPEYYKVRECGPCPRDTDPVEKLHNWGWGRTRRLLFAAYTIAFLCLLRVDEVLKIQIHDIKFVSPTCIKLTLPFRKTNQFGEIPPFFLHALSEEEAHLCPVRALADWLLVSKIKHGYLFRRVAANDRISEQNVPMTSQQFLELFRNNLLDVGIDSLPYGTHSFRRGGCQYLHCCRRWALRTICEWGGWSTEFTHLTIVKYLISSTDDPSLPREDFFNPNRKPAMKCYHCGRSCYCGF